MLPKLIRSLFTFSGRTNRFIVIFLKNVFLWAACLHRDSKLLKRSTPARKHGRSLGLTRLRHRPRVAASVADEVRDQDNCLVFLRVTVIPSWYE
jgi:hypothetical protein